jgi:hypothetical protein
MFMYTRRLDDRFYLTTCYLPEATQKHKKIITDCMPAVIKISRKETSHCRLIPRLDSDSLRVDDLMDISGASDVRVAVDSAAGVKDIYTLSGQYVKSGESITLHALGYYCTSNVTSNLFVCTCDFVSFHEIDLKSVLT